MSNVIVLAGGSSPEREVSLRSGAAVVSALHARTLAGCRDFSRTDIIISPANELSVLETNTIPGMTNQSLFPRMAATDGIDMPTLCDQLIHMALSR